MLSTLASPNAGTARVAGFDIAREGAEVRRHIGVLAHRPMVYEELSALENLRFFARLYDVRDAEPRIEELLRRVGLWRRRHEPAEVLSRGYHQRLALARALVHSPPVLLLDEPETGLDEEGIALLDKLVLEAPGVTVLAATHRLERIDRWADGDVDDRARARRGCGGERAFGSDHGYRGLSRGAPDAGRRREGPAAVVAASHRLDLGSRLRRHDRADVLVRLRPGDGNVRPLIPGVLWVTFLFAGIIASSHAFADGGPSKAHSTRCCSRPCRARRSSSGRR